MDTVVKKSERRSKKINPKKFGMWIALASIVMMFGGFTSGYIVRKSQGNWLQFDLPVHLYISTATVLISSLTMWLSAKSFKKGNKQGYQLFLLLTALLGITFAALQYFGFKELFSQITWNNNVSLQYLFVIIGVHALHILGGVIALLVMTIQAMYRKKPYDFTKENISLSIISAFWHFVGILWIYLFLFFLLNR
ncbi:MAG TPA: cytochrome c oxidase subunit 3 [Chitinophagaceae bacterium]|nr:cytochrome c oxidase subunit 3 [Chitinophagaceae bacterium]